MLQLFNSYTRHLWLGFARNKSYVEGMLNDVQGTVQDNGKMILSYTNSYGDGTVAFGKAKIFGPIVFVYGTAYGYSNHPDGVFLATLGLKTRKHIYLAAPIGINEILTVRIEYTDSSKQEK